MPRADTAQTPDPALWDASRLHDPHAQADKAARVEKMFDAIAPCYERVNRIASLGQDAAWRRRTVALSSIVSTDIVLDVCCGTGDLIRAFATNAPAPRAILGIDFAEGMLAAGSYTGVTTPVHLCRGDALRLPVASASVNVVSCAFGVRNFQDLDRGLSEMRRVLRAGGRVVILEFALPDNALFRAGYRIYCESILPRVAALVSRDRTGAYKYLPQSIRRFERRSAMVARLEHAGFTAVKTVPMNFGGVVVYRGEA
jgi:demethylmenaquinone methyltransferase/2-methoxy-6-polyprenyl-1,4-benzoquinol methylase